MLCLEVKFEFRIWIPDSAKLQISEGGAFSFLGLRPVDTPCTLKRGFRPALTREIVLNVGQKADYVPFGSQPDHGSHRGVVEDTDAGGQKNLVSTTIVRES
jgi:hypothetical protein